MWISMGIIKNEHGVYCVRKKVPKRALVEDSLLIPKPH
jgi:hypothetical protein